MRRSLDAEAGFVSRFALSTSSRLTDAVVASLALGALSLCVVLTLTMLATKLTMATSLAL
jgi:hypothetical protein